MSDPCLVISIHYLDTHLSPKLPKPYSSLIPCAGVLQCDILCVAAVSASRSESLESNKRTSPQRATVVAKGVAAADARVAIFPPGHSLASLPALLEHADSISVHAAPSPVIIATSIQVKPQSHTAL